MIRADVFGEVFADLCLGLRLESSRGFWARFLSIDDGGGRMVGGTRIVPYLDVVERVGDGDLNCVSVAYYG